MAVSKQKESTWDLINTQQCFCLTWNDHSCWISYLYKKEKKPDKLPPALLSQAASWKRSPLQKAFAAREDECPFRVTPFKNQSPHWTTAGRLKLQWHRAAMSPHQLVGWGEEPKEDRAGLYTYLHPHELVQSVRDTGIPAPCLWELSCR